MDNNKDNKKKFVVIIGTLAILLLLVGATYAYFALNVNQGNTKTNINASTTPVDNISLQKSASDLHITLRPDDMALTTLGDYYAVTDNEKNYEKEENIVSLAELTAKGGANNTAYNCEVKITISKNNDDTMTSVLQAKDAEVRLSFGDLLEDIDLVGLKTANIEKTGHITLINNSNDFINAYLKVTNREEDQEYLANKTLNISIDTEVIKCDVIGTSKIELALRNTNESGTLSKELKGGMFRYQGTADDVTDNYICFGTAEQQNCLEHQDKYMYRIIGVTPEGRIKVIKKEALDDTYQWYTDYITDIKWPNSLIFTAINGEKFLTNTEYVPVGWENKIYNNLWTYGDMLDNDTAGVKQTSKGLYETELGKKVTKWNIKSTETEGGMPYQIGWDGNETYSKDTIIYYKEKSKNWSNKVESKISLMYLHDYHYSISDDAKCGFYHGDEEYTKCKSSWIHLSQNDPNAPIENEWTISRCGWQIWYGAFYAFFMHNVGSVSAIVLTEKLSIRPTFFLNNNIEISGSGTEADPYMIN